ncbi:MAG: NOG1 family protein [Candidatus Thorarchaeota archaeon]
MNPFTDLKYIPRSSELLDIAFARASKLTLPKSKKPAHIRIRTKEIAKLSKVEDILTDRLQEVVKRFPNFDEIHPFYRTLADTTVPIDNLRQALASVTSAVRIIKQIVRENIQKLKRVQSPEDARRIRISAYGRISSVINRIKPRLSIIQQAAKEYRRFPSIDLELPVIVIAGFPNVGKSSLVSFLSSATPKIAEYPFTTKTISVGHLTLNSSEGQILDVPGLLDRPMKERNIIERRAIAAIQYLADVIVFLIDPTLTCGYEVSNQVTLFQEIVQAFEGIEIIPVINKSDIASEEEIQRARSLTSRAKIPVISTLTGENLVTFFHEIITDSVKIQEKLRLRLDRSP